MSSRHSLPWLHCVLELIAATCDLQHTICYKRMESDGRLTRGRIFGNFANKGGSIPPQIAYSWWGQTITSRAMQQLHLLADQWGIPNTSHTWTMELHSQSAALHCTAGSYVNTTTLGCFCFKCSSMAVVLLTSSGSTHVTVRKLTYLCPWSCWRITPALNQSIGEHNMLT